jgi:hypothetical protein
MLEVHKRMHELRICPPVSLSGPCVQDVSKLTVREREREDFVLHRVHPEHAVCQAFLVHFAKQTGTEPLDYHGESPGSILSTAFDLLARSGKVRNVSQATRSEVFAVKTGLCAVCGDRLTRFEVDHRTPFFLGVSNDRENLAAVCPPCHRAKCLGESQLHIHIHVHVHVSGEVGPVGPPGRGEDVQQTWKNSCCKQTKCHGSIQE